ncbi:hypothetical protein MAR_026784 [Mya arenaria]|uniref:Uncharacterized protein n=1 Tax=Mya arenaria TaxID=6604 RepID=A0ABY7EW14_MYAAR|nr:hypothetical protein MAR_026784 [Mya arenaria]
MCILVESGFFDTLFHTSEFLEQQQKSLKFVKEDQRLLMRLLCFFIM